MSEIGSIAGLELVGVDGTNPANAGESYILHFSDSWTPNLAMSKIHHAEDRNSSKSHLVRQVTWKDVDPVRAKCGQH